MLRRSFVLACLWLPAALLFAQAENQGRFNITGTVVNALSGAPIRGALVRLQGTEMRSTMADAGGHFEIDGLPSGVASVSAMRQGFDSRDRRQQEKQTQIKIGPGMDPLLVKLNPLARISGRIVDEDGEPIEAVNVQCFLEQMVNGYKQWRPVNITDSDEAGYFTIDDLASGSYLLKTGQKRLYMVPPSRAEAARYIYPPVFYPNAATRDAAQRIEVSPGTDLKIDFALHSVRAARVSFVTIPAYDRVTALMAMTGDEEGSGLAQQSGQKDPVSGAYVLSVVPPGSWRLIVRGRGSGRGHQNHETPWGDLPVEVGRADIENLQVPMAKLPDIQVLTTGTQVVTTGAEAYGSNSVQLVSPKGRMYAAIPAQNGEMWIRGVEPGSYRVRAGFGFYCFASITSESRDLFHEELLVTPRSSPAPIQLVAGDNCASLKLMPAANGNCTAACPPIDVVVTSNLTAFAPQVFGVSEAGYTLTGLHEGEYNIYAFDDATDLEYANPEALRSFKSQTVQLASGQTATVQLEVNHRQAP
jgi:hypothetical protein